MFNRKRIVIFLSVILAVFGLAGFSQLFHVNKQSLKQVKTTAEQALVLDQSSPFYWEMKSIQDIGSLKVKKVPAFNQVKPAEPLHQIVTTYQNPPGFSHKLSQKNVDFQAWTEKTKDLANQLFVPGTKTYHRLLQSVVQASKRNGDVIAIDGGVRNIKWGKIKFDGHSSAHIQGIVDDWASYAQWQDGKGYVPASPHGFSHFNMTLHLIKGKWKVLSLTETFVKGSQP